MKIKWFLLAFMMLHCLSVSAQDLQALKNKLSELGFENINVLPDKIENDTLRFIVGLEHRSLNNPLDIVALAKLVASDYGLRKITVVVQKRGQNMFMVEDHAKNIFSTVNDNIARDLNRNFSINKYRLNVFYLPDVGIRFGYFDNPIQAKINVLLGTELLLGRGLSLFTTVAIPVSNDLDNENRGVGIGPTYLEYFNQFIPNNYLLISTGLFFDNRYGFDFQYRFYPFDSQLSLGLNYSYTGFYYFPKSSIYFEAVKDQMVLLDAEYYFRMINSSVLVQVGRFLDQQLGVYFEVNKQYRNIELGLFGVSNERGFNAGFQFMIPLIPNKIFRTKHLEFRGKEDYRWSYSFSNEGQIGGRFSNSFNLTQGLRRFNYNLFNQR